MVKKELIKEDYPLIFDIRIYPDRSGEWRWRAIAKNGKIVADSSESYKRKRACIEIASRIFGDRPREIYIETKAGD